MIRQEAFAGSERMLKGGLHCHTTRSDGAGSPADVIRYHHEHGYDFLALTDHRVYNFQNYAPEIPITIVPGMEFDSTFEHEDGFRCFHVVCVGPSPNDGNGYRQDERLAAGISTCQEEFQPYLDEIHARRNLTIYCHPQWSSTPTRYFEKLKGNFAMEIWNSGCVMDNDMDADAACWDELLGQGQRIFGVATDDGHGMDQHCHGWVMVRAENDLNAILSALQRGAFYSSCGPEIRDFRVEDDGTAVVECSEAVRVRFHSDRHPTRMVCGEGLTRAACKLGDAYRYVRASLVDAAGRMAWTNPIFLK